MDSMINEAIQYLLGNFKLTRSAGQTPLTADEALKFSQSALNLSHVKGNLEAINQAKKTAGAGS